MGSKHRAAALTILAGVFATPAYAATCNGTLVGTTCTLTGATVTYEYDTATNAAALALYGAPTIIFASDVVRFLPPDFRAESIDGVGTNTGLSEDIVVANFIFDSVSSNSGNEILLVSIDEVADYRIDDGDEVTADVFVTITDNNLGLDFATMQDGWVATGDSGGVQSWVLSASMNPADEFDSALANDFGLSLQNTLTAETDTVGESAWIQKKLGIIDLDVSTTSVVPVPPSVWLFGSGLVLLGWIRRRVR